MCNPAVPLAFASLCQKGCEVRLEEGEGQECHEQVDADKEGKAFELLHRAVGSFHKVVRLIKEVFA